MRSVSFIMFDHLCREMKKTLLLLLLTAPIILTLVALTISLHALGQADCGTGGIGGAGGLGGTAGKGGTNSDGTAGLPGSNISGANGTNLNGTDSCRHSS
jgi:hypothetical protein